MGPRAGFGNLLAGVRSHITVSEYLSSKTILYDAMILVHRQVARLAIHIDKDRDEGIKMVAAGFRDNILDIIHRGIGVVCVFDGGKLPGKGVNQTRGARIARYRALLDELRQGEAACTMPEGEFKNTEKRYLRQCTMVKEDMILACICELERCGIRWRRARFEADAELAHLVQDPTTADHYAAVYSEDLDLVVHGVPYLITSWDVVNDSALMYKTADFKNPPADASSKINFAFLEAVSEKVNNGWSVKEALVTYACLVGCDYIKNVKAIGHTRALKIFKLVDTKGPFALLTKYDVISQHAQT